MEQLLQPGYTKRQVVVRFNDLVQGNTAIGEAKIELNQGIFKVIYLDWLAVSSGLVGHLMSIDELSCDGIVSKSNTVTATNKNYTFWNYFDSASNQTSKALPDNQITPPINISSLTFRLFHINGTPQSFANEYIILEMWCLTSNR